MTQLNDILRGRFIGKNPKHTYMWCACEDCGKERWVALRRGIPSDVVCSLCGHKRRGLACGGSNSTSWKGGRVKLGGYILVWVDPNSPFHPMCGKRNNYVLEHRLVMAEHLGRCLDFKEKVHHKGIEYTGIKNQHDNRIENLELTTQSHHLTEHTRGYRDGYRVGFEDGKDRKIKELQNIIEELQGGGI